ncbi:MAG: hypothetical protein Kow0056_02180 [Coriobacteriia bacterium]
MGYDSDMDGFDEITDDIGADAEGDGSQVLPERPDIPVFTAPRTVGEMLAAERRRQGLSLTDISEATNIRVRMLEALEDDRHDQLPSPAYVKGYIQNYAQVLGISSESLLEAYRRDQREHGADLARTAELAHSIVPKREQQHAIPPRLLATVIAIAAVIGIVWLVLTLAGGGSEEPAPLPPPAQEAPAAQGETTQTPGVTDAPQPEEEAEPAQPQPTPFEMTITVEDDDASWLRVIVDGEKVYEGTLSGGESRTWEVSDLASVRIGRPSVVTITRDGQPVPIPTTGELPTVELAADE